jgi:putative PEP-CTERM system TPR-repeat lipoprotein
VKYRIIGVALLGLALTSRLAGAAESDPLAEAEALVAKGQLRAAEIQLKNAVRSDPKNMAAHYRLAVVQLQLGNAAAAEHEANEARAGGYDPEHTIPFLAQTYLIQQKYRQLLEEFPAEEGSNAQRSGVLVARGYAQLALGKSDEARGSFAEAQKLTPDDVGPLLAQAKVLMAQGQTAAAEPLLDHALRTEPTSNEARLAKAHLLRLSGKLEQARSTLDELLTTNRGYLPGRLERAEILLALNNDQGAKADIDAVLAAQPGNGGALYLEALLAAKAKDFKKANLDLQKISGALPAIPRGYYVLALVQYNLQQFGQAEDAARRYVARNPDDLAGHKLLGAIELALKRPADTVDALAKFESEGKADAQALDLLGRAYTQVGKTSEALAAFSAAVKLAPDDPGLRMQLGGVQIRAGHQNEGIADLERSLELAPLTPAAEMLVVTSLQAGKWDEATATAKKLEKSQPDSPAAGNLLGMIALARFDLEGARTEFAQLAAKRPDFLPAQLNLARVLELQGKSNEAEEILQQILKQRPTDVVVLGRLVELLSKNGKEDAAIAATERAHAASPDNQGITSGLISLYIRHNDKDKALALARLESGSNEASNIPLILARARAESAAGLKGELAETYRRLIEIAPSNISYRRQLAGVLFSNGDVAGAQRVIDQALELAPQNPSLFADRITIAFKFAGLDGALAAAKQLQANNPNLPVSAALEGDAYMIAGQPARAAEAYAGSLKQSPSTMLAIGVAKAKDAAGDANGAAAVLREWLTTHPDDKIVLAMLGGYDLTARRFDEARKELEAASEAMSKDPVVLNNLAWLFQKTGDPRARSFAERAYLAAPNLPSVKDTLGWILVQQGQAGAAIGLLQEASRAEHQNPDVQYHLAAALNAIGRRDEALAILTELFKGQTNFDDKPEAEKLFAELSKK